MIKMKFAESYQPCPSLIKPRSIYFSSYSIQEWLINIFLISYDKIWFISVISYESYDMTHMLWIDWIPRNFKIFIFKQKLLHLRKNYKIVTRVNFLLFTNFVKKIVVFHFRKIYPSFHFFDLPSKMTIKPQNENFEISRGLAFLYCIWYTVYHIIYIYKNIHI